MSLKHSAGPDAPGYLKKLQAYQLYVKKLADVDDPIERYELQLDWLASYLTSPPTKFLKRVAIRRASKNEIDELIALVLGGGVDQKKDEDSDGG